jgi:uncharacterized protein (TIGR02246 family)
MRKRCGFAVALSSVLVLATAAPPARPDDYGEVRALLERNATAWTKNDAALFGETLDAAVVFTENGGINEGRESVLEHVQADHAAVRALAMEIDVQRVQQNGPLAWAYAIERARIQPKQGESYTLKSHSIFVLEKKQERWWIVAHSLSVRKETAPAPPAAAPR